MALELSAKEISWRSSTLQKYNFVILQRRGERMIPAVLNRRSTAALLGKVEFAFMKVSK